MLGIGGRTVDKMVRNDLPTIRKTTPGIVILGMGANDLTSDAQTAGFAIRAFVKLLHDQYIVKYIMTYEVIPRASTTILQRYLLTSHLPEYGVPTQFDIFELFGSVFI